MSEEKSTEIVVNTIRPKHRNFCNEYLKDYNAEQAYIRTYPNVKVASARRLASNLLTNINIRAYIAQRIKEREEIVLYDAAYVVEGLKSVYSRCMQAAPVTKFDFLQRREVQVMADDDNGNPVGVYQFDAQNANKALELLGKAKGLFDNKIAPDKPNILADEQYAEMKAIAMERLRIARATKISELMPEIIDHVEI